MTVTLNLKPEVEAQIAQKAAAEGTRATRQALYYFRGRDNKEN